MKLYSLYENMLYEIEKNLGNDPTADKLANGLFVSSVHLQRLFKEAFGVPLAGYIRSRKLAASLDMLLNSKAAILDIAVTFGFEHAQSYIRAFKGEFGLTPGELRKTGQIVSIKPPIQMFPANRLSEGVLFGPKIVFVPEFHCVGISHVVPYSSDADVAAGMARDFYLNHINKIPNIKLPDVYFGITKFSEDADYSTYIPSVCVRDLSEVPEGFVASVIPSCLCVKFHYIGEHHPMDLDADIMDGMYDAIGKFEDDERAKYGMYKEGLYFERIALADYDGTYCKMEWFSPVHEK